MTMDQGTDFTSEVRFGLLGYTPTPEFCVMAPPLQRLLAKVLFLLSLVESITGS
jgi:hypothetical protein